MLISRSSSSRKKGARTTTSTSSPATTATTDSTTNRRAPRRVGPGRSRADQRARSGRHSPSRSGRSRGVAGVHLRAELEYSGSVLRLEVPTVDATALRELVRRLQPTAGVLGKDLAEGRQASADGGRGLLRRRSVPQAVARARFRNRPWLG